MVCAPMCYGVGVFDVMGGKWGVVDSMLNMLCFTARRRMEKLFLLQEFQFQFERESKVYTES